MEENNYPEVRKAGIIGIIFSFLIPLVGLILYFVKKGKVMNPSAYLWAALAGVVLGLVLQFFMPTAQIPQ